MQDLRTFGYKLAYAPAFVCEPKPELVQQLQANFHAISLDCFEHLRKHNCVVSRDTLVSSLCGGITLAEFCLLWIHMRVNNLKRHWLTYDSKHKQMVEKKK